MASFLKGTTDTYGGITVLPENVPDCSDEQFESILRDSLQDWRLNNIRGLWLSIPISKSSFIPIAVKHGFVFHHAKPDYLMLNLWLPTNESNKLPLNVNTGIGVGGFVLNDKNEILVVKEKHSLRPFWKFPGGMADPGEEIAETAIREVREETGIITEFKSIICFRHTHHGLFDFSNIYVVVRLTPLTFDITLDETEIIEGKWLPLETYIADPTIITLNREIAILAKNNAIQTNNNPTLHEFVPVPTETWNKKGFNLVYKIGSSL